MSRGITPFKEYYRHDYDSDEMIDLYDTQYQSGTSSTNLTYETVDTNKNTPTSSDVGEKTGDV